MTVFKAYMKITKKLLPLGAMYFGIFFAIVLFQKMGTQAESAEGYANKRVKVGIVNLDGGRAADALIETLEEKHEVTMLENDKEAIQENLFYSNIEYVLTIPEHFMETCIQCDNSIEVTTMPGTYAGMYVDQQIGSFLNYARSCSAAGMKESEIYDILSETETVDVEMKDFSGNEGRTPDHIFFYRYLVYMAFSVLSYLLGYILMAFRKGMLKQRMLASAVPAWRQNLEGFLATGVLTAGLWIVCTGLACIMYGKQLLGSGQAGWLFLNSAAVFLVSLSIAYAIGLLVENADSLNGIVNIVGLGMCFLCGVFVDMDFLSSSVKTVARFLPFYWYEIVNQKIGEYGSSVGTIKGELLSGIGIQILFAAAFASLALVIAGRKDNRPVRAVKK